MPSVYKRSKTWTENVFLIVDGKRTRKTKSGFTTKAAANQWATDTEYQKQNDLLITKSIVFVDAFEEWFHVFKEPRLQTSTKQWYKRTISLLNEKWKDKLITNITSRYFQKLINDYGENHVKSSVSF